MTLVGVKGQIDVPELKPHVIDQVGCIYIPYVSSCFTGQTVRVFNSDPALHNVHVNDPNYTGSARINPAQLPNGPPIDLKFDEPMEFMKFKCDVHPWMFAYLSVVPHPFHDVTDMNGRFEFPLPPPGEYVIKIRHRKIGIQERKFTVTAGGHEELKFEFSIEGE
ncbi:MAG: hypothetical protein CMO80_17845 [Verrucomicrobiales bacterium]|nr:hypothetical protein [Verrucomicrobiales bacterium]